MVNIQRLALALVFIACGFLLSPKANATEYRLNIAQYVTAWNSSRAAVCAAFTGMQPSSQTDFVIDSSEPSCSYHASIGYRTFDYESRADFCTPPQVLTVDGNGCRTPAPVTPPYDAALDSLNRTGVQFSGAPSLTVCVAGKSLKGTSSGCNGTAVGGAANCTTSGPFTDTGVPCVGTGGVGANGLPAPNTDPPLGTPSNCGAGLTPGTINGVGVCLKPSTGNTQQSTSSGSTSTTPTINADGSPGPGLTGIGPAKTGTSETTCTGNSCTTVTRTTSTTASGSVSVATEKKDESKDDYCTKNPRSPLCVTSTFGGACTAGFQCDGDAVQCALAKEVFTQNCKMNERNAQADLFDNEIVKFGNRTNDLPGNSTINLSSASFDQSNALGVAAQCIQDVTVTVMGNTAVLPFSRVCAILEQLGSVMLAVSFLLAARIVTRG